MDCSPPGSSVQGISQQECWSGFPFPSPGDLPDPDMGPASPALAGRYFTTAPLCVCVCVCVCVYKVLRSIKVDVEKWAKKMKIISNFIWILGILPGGKGPRQYSTCELSSVYPKHEDTGFLHTCCTKMPLIISTFSLFVSSSLLLYDSDHCISVFILGNFLWDQDFSSPFDEWVISELFEDY